MHYVYITENLANGKKYIGQGKLHQQSHTYMGSGKLLLYAIKKYGKENFLKHIIHTDLTQEQADELEIKLIKERNACFSEEYYNIDPGGQYGRHEMHSQYMSARMKKVYENDLYLENVRRSNIQNHIKRANKEGRNLPYNSYEEYLKYKRYLDNQKIYRQKLNQIIRNEKEKQKDFDTWFKDTPIGKEIEYQKKIQKSKNSKKSAKKMWKKSKQVTIESMKNGSRNRYKQQCIKDKNYIKMYLYSKGISEFEKIKINQAIYNIKRANRKIEAVEKQVVIIENTTNNMFDIQLNTELLKELAYVQFNINT